MSFFSRLSGTTTRPSAYVNHETQQSELERLRGRQLASLVRAGGRARNHAQTTFEVPVVETQRGPLLIVVTLPQDFPMRAPHVQASMPVQHPWLDATGNVQSHPDLNQWTAHSDLGRIVSEIVAELRRQAASLQASVQNPKQTPQNQQQQQSASASTAASSQLYPPSYPQYITSATPPTPPTPPKKDPPQLQRSQMPVIPAIFPALEELSISQLENLSNDRHALRAFVHELDSVQEFLRLRAEVMNGNIAIADKTLSYEARMRELQSEVHELREKLHASQASLAEKQARQQRIVARHRPDALLEQLSVATRDLDASSDDTASRFTHGEIDYATFISEFLAPRTLFHQRTLKLNRVLQN